MSPRPGGGAGWGGRGLCIEQRQGRAEEPGVESLVHPALSFCVLSPHAQALAGFPLGSRTGTVGAENTSLLLLP